MADQKRWFKLWHSALSDDELTSLDPALRWAWAALGAHTKVHGTNGSVIISMANGVLAAQMGVPLERVLETIKVLPHVRVEEGLPDNGRFTVTWRNWLKYQEDSTVALRVARLRSKRRGEEKRGEETLNSKDILGADTPKVAETDAPVSKFKRPTPEDVTGYAESLNFKLDGRKFCDHYEAKGWVLGRSPMRDWRAAVRTWQRMDKERGFENGNGRSSGKIIGRD